MGKKYLNLTCLEWINFLKSCNWPIVTIAYLCFSQLFGPILVGLTNCDEALPALIGEAESAWPEAPTLGGLQKGIPRCWLTCRNEVLGIKLGNIYCMALAVCNLAKSDNCYCFKITAT